MPMKSWRFLASLAALAVLGGVLPAWAQAPIKIGASLSLTGTYGKIGSYQKAGYERCAADLNKKGGLLGRKVEFGVSDDQSAPATGVRGK